MSSFSCYMHHAVEIAKKGALSGEVPVGAVVVYYGDAKPEIIASAHNMVLRNNDKTAHAEIVAIRAAAAKMAKIYSKASISLKKKSSLSLEKVFDLNIAENPTKTHYIKNDAIKPELNSEKQLEKLNNVTFSPNLLLQNCDIYVTLEPCPMCAHAIALSRIRRLYYGASNTECNFKLYDLGGGYSKFNYIPEVYPGILEGECGQIIQEFFANLRN